MALSRRMKFGYGVGHVFNDLCASMWFTYLLVYFQYVLQLDRGLSGFLLMLGQIADAVATPLIGLQSDRGCTIWSYGRRKSWHAIGSLCVLVSFPFIFIVCGLCFAALGFGYIIMLGFMICLFQETHKCDSGDSLVRLRRLISATQETHKCDSGDSLVRLRRLISATQETHKCDSGDSLVRLRRLISATQETHKCDSGDSLIITIIVIIVGSAFTIVFHVLTPERPSTRRPTEAYHEVRTPEAERPTSSTDAPPQQEREPHRPRVQMQWRDWLTEPQFYQVTMLYSASRLVTNLSTIYMPIYLQETLHARQELSAIVPLVMSLSGVGASFLLRALRKALGKKASVVVGILVGLLACTLSSLPWMPEWGVFSVAILWGSSGSLLVIISLAFTADLIGRSTNSSAFVYGSMSFGDKIVNGVAVFAIQELTRAACQGPNCSSYYRHIMSLGIFVPLMFCFIAICLISRQKLGRTRKLVQAQRDEEEASGSSVSSESDELLLSTGTNLGYGAITKA
ncbi:major facilitator superfamily domain-containing protein 12-like [Panulirus ornatus]|uniref:major facilitator superfamily domain-containing protein 12-like n=1 Tax=Panulirus ornatus TaxID=150431 RepID=UPI003A83AC25